MGVPFKVGVHETRKKRVPAFGTPLQELCMSKCFGLHVPSVLVVLWLALLEAKGAEVEGIFRLAPSASEREDVLREIGAGCLRRGHTAEAIATVIKIFFRKLPRGGLLGALPPDVIEGVVTQQDGAARMMATLPAESADALRWVVQVIRHISKKSDVNRMGVRNLALVIAPNLLGDDLSPLQAIQATEAGVQAIQALYEAAERGRPV